MRAFCVWLAAAVLGACADFRSPIQFEDRTIYVPLDVLDAGCRAAPTAHLGSYDRLDGGKLIYGRDLKVYGLLCYYSNILGQVSSSPVIQVDMRFATEALRLELSAQGFELVHKGEYP